MAAGSAARAGAAIHGDRTASAAPTRRLPEIHTRSLRFQSKREGVVVVGNIATLSGVTTVTTHPVSTRSGTLAQPAECDTESSRRELLATLRRGSPRIPPVDTG